jgi:hypothetical protein
MSDISHETARQPLQPWQYIMVVIAVIGAIGVLWFFLRGGEIWHRETLKPVERSASGPAPVFIGAPDDQEADARNNVRAVSTQAAAVDESAEFNAPLMNQQQQPSHLLGELESRSASDAAPAPLMASANANSSGSLFTATAVAYRVPHPTYTIRKGTVIPCTDVTAIDTSSGGNVGVTASLPMDVWSMDHHMILLGKGATVAGEVGHGLVNGLDRLGVVWREFTTPPPDSVGVSISSPAVGPLGEGGLDGDVNRHAVIVAGRLEHWPGPGPVPRHDQHRLQCGDERRQRNRQHAVAEHDQYSRHDTPGPRVGVWDLHGARR